MASRVNVGGASHVNVGGGFTCECGRWLREVCATDCAIDDEGKEHICHPYS